jgi:hypothetical protein
VFITSYSVTGQTFTGSNLPIVIITTDNDPSTNLPLEIIDEPKILASMKLSRDQTVLEILFRIKIQLNF